MKHRILYLSAGLLLLALLLLGGNWILNPVPTSALKDKIYDARVSAYLVKWVDENRQNGQLDARVTRSYVGGPGMGPVQIPFDWSILGLNPSESQIRLIGSPQEWKAVYFSASGVEGVLVALNNDFGVPSKRVRLRNGRVAIYLDSRD